MTPADPLANRQPEWLTREVQVIPRTNPQGGRGPGARGLALCVSALLLVPLLPAGVPANPHGSEAGAAAPKGPGEGYVPGEIILRLHKEAASRQRAGVL